MSPNRSVHLNKTASLEYIVIKSRRGSYTCSTRCNGGVIITTKVKSLHQIVNKARQVVQLIVKIATASKEQSSGIQQVNVAVSQMNKVTQANAAGAEETASASEDQTAQAGELKNAVLQLQVLINGSSASSNRI